MGMHDRAERLPSLPQILLHILDASQHEGAAVSRLAEVVRRDPATTTRLLQAANSAAYRSTASNGCTTIERALMVLGTETVRTIVITAAIQQFIGGFVRAEQQFLKQFWRNSLQAATAAHVFATLTRYRNPSEAYLCGLLHNIGQLVLLRRHRQEWLQLWRDHNEAGMLAAEERSRFQDDHIELSARLLTGWPDSELLADALRYRLEPASRMRDASHLAKIINLAAALALPQRPDDAAVQRADALFGIGEALLQELSQQISSEVSRVAEGLGIDISADTDTIAQADAAAHQQLGEQISEITQLTQWSAELRRARTLELFHTAVQRVVFMTLGIRDSVLFVVSADGATLQATLRGTTGTGAPDFAVPLQPDRNPISDALLTQSPRTITDSDSVLERQLLRACRAERLVCLPLLQAGQPIGVLVLGLQPEALDPLARSTTTAALCHEIASALQMQLQRHQRLTAGSVEPGLARQVSEALHEAGNPLTIVRNYLELLRARLGDDHDAAGELSLIREEIDRVGNILLRLRDPDASALDEAPGDLDALLDNLAQIFERSLCATHGITLRRHGRAGGHLVEQPAQLKQILINLMKNAVEAMPQGGVLELAVESPVVANGQLITIITVRDNGPGIPPSVLASLFQPVTTTKGGTHAGLGLSIVKRLVEELEGTIVCRSSEGGTTFELLLPRAPLTETTA